LVVDAGAHLFEPAPAYQYGTSPRGGEFTAQHYFVAPNPAYGAEVTYWLGEEAEEVAISVTDEAGSEMWSQDVPGLRGVHTVRWNLRGPSTPLPLSPSEARDSIAMVARLEAVADSLVEEGEEQDQVNSAVERLMARAGGRRGFGGGGGGEGLPFTPDGVFIQRPAEGGEVDADDGGAPVSLQQRISQIIRPTEGRRRRNRGGAGLLPGRTEPAAMAEPGRYTVTLTVEGVEYVQAVEVGWALSAPSR
jgi:hypothetical protein